MDALNHALAGSLVADALPFTRKLGKYTQIAAVLAGMAPDLDFLPAFIVNFPPKKFSFHGLLDFETATRYHRAESHSFFYAALAAIVLGALARRFISDGKGSWWHWPLLLWLAFASHIILDLTNPWDVRCWLPFSDRREAWCLMPLRDAIFTGILAVVFLLNNVLRDTYPDAQPLSPWREKTSGVLNRLIGVPTVAWIAIVPLVLRVWLTVYYVFSFPVDPT